MKLVFFKEGEEVKLKINNGEDTEFNYVKLIEFLHTNNELEETEYWDGISEEEKNKVNAMIDKINEVVVKYTPE
ncbi:hypothetical protein [Sulfurimonas sp. CS5]|uniref:hypothetical protein n=1 Tax=Sulfurimonas sp. CS5 TaxID=3391145 RepID=UPI0039EB94F7